jgi:hypothetical protein
VLALLALLFTLLIGGRDLSLFAQSANPIQIENQNPGTTGWLLTNVAANNEIEGYASLTSVNAGGQVSFFVNTIDSKYTLTIYRLGYYGGLGGRQMTQPVTLSGISQPIPTPDPDYGMVECQWSSPYVFNVPSNWVSGVYVVKLVGSQSGKQQYITFVVRNDDRVSDFIFQSSVSTYQAYNAWGGKSLYSYNSTDGEPAVKVSYNRPYDDSQGAGNLLEWELDMLAYLEQEGYDVVYSTNVDTHESPSQLLLHKGFLSVGHDEYWSYEMRQNVTAARDQGVNLGFFSGDTSNWQIRFEPSPVTGAIDRTEVGYKEQWQDDPDASDPSTYYLVTANWGTTRFTYPGNPEEELIGAMYNGYEPVDANIVVTNPSSWVFANTGLKSGSALTGLLGYEADREEGNQPSNTVVLAHSPYTYSDGSTQYGDMTVYQAPSGATVFAVGTVQWMYGLSSLSPWGPSSPLVNPAAQQITNNVLMQFVNSSTGAPSPSATPGSGVVKITAPANGATVAGTVNIAVSFTSTRTAKVSWVNVYVDGNYFASTPPTSFSWNSTTVASGSHTISATAFNSSGVSLGSASISVTVQNGVKASPSKTSTVTGTATPTSHPTATAIATIAMTATPTAVSTHTSTPIPTTVATATSTIAVTPVPTPTAAPVLINITAPANGATLSGTVNIGVQIIVQKGTTKVSWADLYIDGEYFASTPPTTFSWDSSTVPNGLHTISATGFSSKGVVLSTASISVTVSN